MSNLKFWNKNHDNNDSKTEAKNAKNGRNWLHAPDALLNGHVAYLVKFLGTTPVDQPKGIEVVKEAIRRLQFTQQIKKSDGGNNSKMKKVEITISVDGVAVQVRWKLNFCYNFFRHFFSICRNRVLTTFYISSHFTRSVTVPTKRAWKSFSASSLKRVHLCKRTLTATRLASTHHRRLRLEAWQEPRKNLTSVMFLSRTNSLPISHWRLARPSTWLIAVTWPTAESNLKSQSFSRTTRSWRAQCRHIEIDYAKLPRFSRNQIWTNFCFAWAFETFARCKWRLQLSMEIRHQIWVSFQPSEKFPSKLQTLCREIL